MFVFRSFELFSLSSSLNILKFFVSLKLLDVQVFLQTGGHPTKNHPHIREVEILTLPLPGFEPWSLVPILQPQNQLNYIHAGLNV